ncbi:acyl carrier protein [Streptomyces specialis]|uniref:acyl carrier protein n=1 Tax=Streptomyces specialis TaxID=498367 RepID=UPI00073E426C
MSVAQPAEAAQDTVLATVADMIREILGGEDLAELDIDMETRFGDDLELESIDMVALSESLEAHYGDRVNFAAFVAEMELDEIISLTVGRLVDYVVASLRAAEES